MKSESNIEQRLAMAKQKKTDQEQRVFASLSQANWVPRDRDNMEVIKWLRSFVDHHRSELNELTEEGHGEGDLSWSHAATPAASRHAAMASDRKRRCVRAVIR